MTENKLDQQLDAVATQLGDCAKGFIEIGSRARGEAISLSDHDIRIIVRTDSPYIVSQDHAWSSPPESSVRTLGWQDLNRVSGISFGITNLGYVEANVIHNHFPLADHTALFQGVVLRDVDGHIASFVDMHEGRRFSNVARDYLSQTHWRVHNRLAKEIDEAWFFDHLDAIKQAIPAIHTCCRIVNDIAQIASYLQQQHYLRGHEAVFRHCEMHWPAWIDAIREMFVFKVDEHQRRDNFDRAIRREPQAYEQVLAMAQMIQSMWNQFVVQIGVDDV